MAFIKSTSTVTDTAITVDGLTGGNNGNVVRINGNNTVTNCAWTDTASQLNNVLFKQGDIYYAAGVVPGVGGLTAGTSYFLGETGGLTSAAPTPTSTVRALFIGFALNSDDLLFRPGIPVSG